MFVGLTPHLGGRLWQQYIVDAFTPIEQYRLDQISRNQTTIRSDLYNSVRDAVRRGENDPSHVAKCVILPASFTGCKRYMSQYYKDSLALCRSIGHPTLFLTMTCNSKWPEIKEMMQHLPGVDISDAPDVTARVFKQKVDQLIDLIKKQNFFGRCIGRESTALLSLIISVILIKCSLTNHICVSKFVFLLNFFFCSNARYRVPKTRSPTCSHAHLVKRRRQTEKCREHR